MTTISVKFRAPVKDDISPDFWSKFVTSRNKRNDLIHHGSDANVDDAEDAILVAEMVILHIRRLESKP